MPFTLAHPAIVIPLSRTKWRLSLTGLITGSIAPDLEYFIHMREVENIGHHWYGILLFDLPMSILACFLFHNLIRNSFIANLPGLYRKRFIRFKGFYWNRYAKQHKWIVLVSILIGILSHLGWDAFTHHDGFVVQYFPFLSRTVELMDLSVPVYFILQVAFSIAGMVMVHQQIMHMPIQQSEAPDAPFHMRYWLAFTLLFFTIASLRLIIWPEFNSFGGVIIAIMGSLLYSWLPVSIIFKSRLQSKTSNHEYL